jgi:hypothetical protein
MSTLYAIDPGTERSAVVALYAEGLISGQLLTNDGLILKLRGHAVRGDVLVIEQIESMGMAVGKETFETVFWSGRFAQAWDGEWSRVTRRAVKLHLCGSMKAKDANIRQALIDRYGGPSCIKKGGPLAGIKSHLWAALAVAVTYRELQQAESVGLKHER